MHHASFSSPDFQASYAEEPLPFCANCHAPRAKDRGAQEGGSRGIDCESCHPGAEHHATAARASIAAAKASAPHDVRACAACHELTSEGSGTFLQSTATEHAASASREVPCAECHMKSVAPRGRDHRFAVSRDAAFLAKSLALTRVARAPTEVTFSLAARGVGHKLPTGDIFRELFVRAWVESAEGKIVGEMEASLHRDWDAHRAAFGSARGPDPLADTRLDETPRSFTIAIASSPGDEAAPRVLRVTVDYRRGFEARAGRLSTFATLRVLDETHRVPSR